MRASEDLRAFVSRACAHHEHVFTAIARVPATAITQRNTQSLSATHNHSGATPHAPDSHLLLGEARVVVDQPEHAIFFGDVVVGAVELLRGFGHVGGG